MISSWEVTFHSMRILFSQSYMKIITIIQMLGTSHWFPVHPSSWKSTSDVELRTANIAVLGQGHPHRWTIPQPLAYKWQRPLSNAPYCFFHIGVDFGDNLLLCISKIRPSLDVFKCQHVAFPDIPTHEFMVLMKHYWLQHSKLSPINQKLLHVT